MTPMIWAAAYRASSTYLGACVMLHDVLFQYHPSMAHAMHNPYQRLQEEPQDAGAVHTRRSSSLVSSDKFVTRTLFSSLLLFILSPVSPAARFRRLGGTYPPVFAPAAGRLLMPPGVPSCTHRPSSSILAHACNKHVNNANCKIACEHP